MNGYAGQILRVDLREGAVEKERLDPKLAADYLGGRGFGITLRRGPPRRQPPGGPKNKLIVSSGPLSGLLVPGAGKMDFTTKSPATGGYASASMGGLLSAEL